MGWFDVTPKDKSVMGRKTPPFEPFPQWTEARFWGFLRSALRQASVRYPPKLQAKILYRRKYNGEGRQKWEYQCVDCKEWFADKNIEVDHIEPVGTLKDWDDLPLFCKRLFCGIDGYALRCRTCHTNKTNRERDDKHGVSR